MKGMNEMLKRIFSKKFVVVCFYFTVLLVSLFWFLSQYFLAPGMVASFKEVRGFTRNISLLSTVDGSSVIQTNLMQGKELSSNCIYEYLPTGDGFYGSIPAIAVTPDNSRFYICQENRIVKYDGTGRLMKSLTLPEFNLNPYQYRRLEKAQASNDTLWLSLSFGNGRRNKDVIVEWPMGDATAIPEILPSDPDKKISLFGEILEPDGIREHCGTVKWGGMLDAKEVIGTVWPQVNAAEVVAGDSLIDDDVSLIDLPGKTSRNITHGSQAKWGADGYIYFIRKGTQLWRVKPGDKPEAVYKATGFARERHTRYGHELVFNTDRTCLAFCYRVPIHEFNRNKYSSQSQLSGAVRCGVIVIDLKTNEYRKISEKTFYNIYQNLHSKNLNLGQEVNLSLLLNKHIWHIENMALIVEPKCEN